MDAGQEVGPCPTRGSGRSAYAASSIGSHFGDIRRALETVPAPVAASGSAALTRTRYDLSVVQRGRQRDASNHVSEQRRSEVSGEHVGHPGEPAERQIENLYRAGDDV